MKYVVQVICIKKEQLNFITYHPPRHFMETTQSFNQFAVFCEDIDSIIRFVFFYQVISENARNTNDMNTLSNLWIQKINSEQITYNQTLVWPKIIQHEKSKKLISVIQSVLDIQCEHQIEANPKNYQKIEKKNFQTVFENYMLKPNVYSLCLESHNINFPIKPLTCEDTHYNTTLTNYF